MSSQNVVTDLINRALPLIRADMRRFAAGLDAMTAANERPSASAMSALRSARDRAAAARQSLLHAPGRIYLIPGGGQAIRGFLYLNQGLSALISGLSSTGSTATGELAAARTLLARSGDEFHAADRALGCPYGCHKPPVVPRP